VLLRPVLLAPGEPEVRQVLRAEVVGPAPQVPARRPGTVPVPRGLGVEGVRGRGRRPARPLRDGTAAADPRAQTRLLLGSFLFLAPSSWCFLLDLSHSSLVWFVKKTKQKKY
jgi:hypothetical protein